MRFRNRAGAIIAAAISLAVVLVSTEALAFRMIQNTGVGRFSAGYAVPCNSAGGFTHWTTASIPFRHNTANQGSGKGTALSAAAAAWTGVSGASHNVTIAGTTTAGFVTDGINTLRWATGSGCTGSCLALTALVLASGQRITETDGLKDSFDNNTPAINYDGSVIAFVLYYWLVHKIDVTKSMLIALVTPVVAVILGMIVLDEEIGWRTLIGGAMIMTGISFIVVRRSVATRP